MSGRDFGKGRPSEMLFPDAVGAMDGDCHTQC